MCIEFLAPPSPPHKVQRKELLNTVLCEMFYVCKGELGGVRKQNQREHGLLLWVWPFLITKK